MSPLRARKAIPLLGGLIRVNVTLRSVADFLRDFLPDGHVAPGRRPWSSITVGSSGLSYNTKRRTGRVDLPGPLSYETGPFGTRHQVTDPDHIAAPPSRDALALPAPYVPDEEAEGVDCPRCGAEPDGPCRTATTGRPTQPHAARITRALDARP